MSRSVAILMIFVLIVMLATDTPTCCDYPFDPLDVPSSSMEPDR